MKCVTVNDASCLIDIRKGGVLDVLLDLPYRFVVPLPIRESEILDFSVSDWQHLDNAGLITYDLTSDEFEQALALRALHPLLSANDCICHVTARIHSGILLTGDNLLRKVADANNLQVHGVLWIIDQLDEHHLCSRSKLVRTLRVWVDDAAVFLPRSELCQRITKFNQTRM